MTTNIRNVINDSDLMDQYQNIWDSQIDLEPTFELILCEKTHKNGLVSENPVFDWRPGKGFSEVK